MTRLAGRYADWKAPREDGGVLVWPSGKEIVGQTGENQRRLSGEEKARVMGVAVGEVRKRMRGWLGHEDGVPLVATGHQTELYHPGVWVKNVLIGEIAKAVGGRGYLFAVDTDEPKHLSLKWPGGSIGVTDDVRAPVAAWSGLLAPPTPGHIAMMEDAVDGAKAGWGFEPVVGGVLRSLRRLSLEAELLAPALVNALHELDWGLGLRHDALVVSPMFGAEPYLMFVYDLMMRGGELAGEYNGALADYRREQGIRTVGRPMPDLGVGREEVESPFWVDDLTTGQRARARLVKTVGGWSLGGSDGFVFEGGRGVEDFQKWLRGRNWRVSPRALTLTLFLRMFVADQFVHGIGGGRYDQVTDRLIERFYGVEAPCFSVATGTLYFPTAAGRERVCVPCLAQEGHRVRHGGLGERKLELVGRIGGLPRGSMERREVFQEMHRELKEAGAELWREWERKVEEVRRIEAEEAVLFDRELFYGMQSRERLEGMRGRCGEMVG